MSKIDLTEWEEFKIEELFDIHPTKAYKKINIDLLENNGVNPVIVNTGFNNGVGGFSHCECTEKAGTITFTDTAAKSSESFFYHVSDFIGYPHVQGMYPKNHELTLYEGLFLTTVLKEKVKGKYDFIRKMTRADVLSLKVELPALVNSDGSYSPNWKYMNDFMKDIYEESEKIVNQFSNI